MLMLDLVMSKLQRRGYAPPEANKKIFWGYAPGSGFALPLSLASPVNELIINEYWLTL